MTYRILTICTGNICRSPMARYVLERAVAEAGLQDQVEVSSAGTTSWEEGEPIDPRAARVLRENGMDPSGHRARQMEREELLAADLVLALDVDHVAPVRRVGGSRMERTLHLVREFDPEAGEDLGIRDPWYGDDADFDLTYDLILAAIPGILRRVREDLAATRA